MKKNHLILFFLPFFLFSTFSFGAKFEHACFMDPFFCDEINNNLVEAVKRGENSTIEKLLRDHWNVLYVCSIIKCYCYFHSKKRFMCQRLSKHPKFPFAVNLLFCDVVDEGGKEERRICDYIITNFTHLLTKETIDYCYDDISDRLWNRLTNKINALCINAVRMGNRSVIIRYLKDHSSILETETVNCFYQYARRTRDICLLFRLSQHPKLSIKNSCQALCFSCKIISDRLNELTPRQDYIWD